METQNFRYIGRDFTRKDSLSKVTGKGTFIEDISFPGMLFAKVVRSEIAHGTIRRIDFQDALKVEGVVIIVTGSDCDTKYGICLTDRFPIAKDKVRFVGEPVAVVIGKTQKAAQIGASKVKIDYNKLPHVLHPKEGAEGDAPIIHESLEAYAHVGGISPIPGTNIFQHFKIRRGNIQRAFEEAHLVIENEYWFPPCHHVQLEPHGAIAKFENDSLIMWTSSQAPFIVRREASHILHLPSAKVRIIVPYVGGGFGGKSDVTIEPLLAYVSSKLPGKYIKLILTREEMFDGTVIGRGGFTQYNTAFSKEGKVLAQSIKTYLNAGGYGDCAVNIVSGMGMAATGPYEVENLEIDSFGVYTNTPPTGAYRGYGHPEVHFGAERQMDIAATKLGIDPIKIRQINAIVPGKKNAIGQVMNEHNGRLDLCIDKVKEAMDWDKPFDKGIGRKVKGRGVAAYMKTPVMPTNAQSGAIMKLNEDGTISLTVGAVEMGQGCYTSLVQIASEALNIPPDLIAISQEVDTQYSPYEWQTVASHTTWAVGNAIIKASEILKDKIVEAASSALKCPSEDLYIDGDVVSTKDKGKSIALKELSVGYADESGKSLNSPIMAEGSFVPAYVTYLDSETGQGNQAADWTFGATGVELEADTVSGDINIIQMVNAIDAGTIISPKLAEGQVIGAMVQALGGVISEKLVFSKEGEIRNNSLVDYKIPELLDIPPIKNYFVETPEETGPFGAKGIGEHGTIGVAPAIANGIKDALGIEIYSLPINPDTILFELKKGGEGK